ncbi:unnamed protein product [Prorocentrum cordatum]|uniref:BTB domain-containing protein n=1 Tax=Prorocentrum cordatum TaxID=2364126 RepID=A0ABN9VMT9_9DINO|nr:unnamed protein product [Polarella glacialis]
MVHKAVLLARSEVFRRMFAHNMQEAIDGAISVPEIDADTADCFTHFLYAGRLLGEEGGAYGLCLRLLPLAKKYEVNSLVSFCAARLTYYLAESNAAELLRLADMYDVLPLKQHVVKFIARSMDTLRAVQDTAEFDKLDANLIKEVVSTMVAHCGAKHPRDEAEQVLEFPDGSDWARLSVAQLRRACSERKLPSAGLRAALLSRLSAGAVAPAAP